MGLLDDGGGIEIPILKEVLVYVDPKELEVVRSLYRTFIAGDGTVGHT